MLHKLRQLQRFGLVLAMLLFCLQFASLLHAHDLEQHLDNSQCQLCLHGNSPAHALPSPDLCIPTANFVQCTQLSIEQVQHGSVHTVSYHSRAPPHHT